MQRPMIPTDEYLGQPIRSLQTMLRTIAESQGRNISVIPDGIYGKNTIAEVTAFQRRKGLSATGVTNQETWDAIVAEYEPALILVDEATPLQLILNPNQIIRKGERHPNVYLLQAVLIVLAEAYGSIPSPTMSGIIDLPTSDSLAEFQLLSGLPVTGELDKITWDRLARQYPMATRLIVTEEIKNM